MNQHSSRTKKYYSVWIGAVLLAASLFHFSRPVFSAGTAPDTVLKNTATGTYEDDAGNDYTIESNTVEVTVGKVAGITNQPTFFDYDNTGPGGSALSTGDRATFEFTITNVGNDVSDIFIPALADIIPDMKGLRTTIDNTDNLNNLVMQVSAPVAPGGAAPTFGAVTATNVPDSRPANGIVKNVPENGYIVVRITSTVTATAANAPIEVLLGDTANNTSPNSPDADTQNQPTADTNNPNGDDEDKDVRTLTADNGSGIRDGDPIDGQKEASALNQKFLGSSPLAIARIEKVRGATVDDNSTPADLSDDIIDYSLSLDVVGNSPSSFFTSADLKGRDYTPGVGNPNTATFTGTSAPANINNLILVSDAIPANTKLHAFPAAPPAGWITVYSEDTGLPDEIEWKSVTTDITGADDEARLGNIKRIGWVYDVTAAGSALATGTTEGTFDFQVRTVGLTTSTGGAIANIAQVYGSTEGGDTDVFDESGDQDGSNFNGTNPGPDEDDPLSTGIADPATHGTDTGNDNSGGNDANLASGGEDNVVVINNAVSTGLLLGTSGQPAATGNVFEIASVDNNHDFQNLGVDNFPTDAKHNDGDVFDPAPVTFTNTLNNPTSNAINGVLIQPINPEFDSNLFDNNGVLDNTIPAGTVVTIKRGTQESIYDYDGSTFSLNTTLSTAPVVVPPLNPNDSLDYDVIVDLPAGTGLSTDDAINRGFAIPIVAFSDNGVADGTPSTGDNYNLTVNQVYTGFVKIHKQVRVIGPDGQTRTTPNPMGFNQPDANKIPAPGDILEYRVIYRNISEPQPTSGANNGILNGVGVLIDENGTIDAFDATPQAPDGTNDGSDNNWGLDNNVDGDIDTLHVQGEATDTHPDAVITFYAGGAADIDSMSVTTETDPNTEVTGYRSTIPTLAPTGAETGAALTTYNGGNGDYVLIFQRKVDEFDGLTEEGLD